MSALPNRKENLDVPQLQVNDDHGSFSSIHSSERSYSPGTSPRPVRKLTGLKKIIPWRKRSRFILDTNAHATDTELAKEDTSYNHTRKKKTSIESRAKELEIRKKRSRSVDHLLTDPNLRANFEVSPPVSHRVSYGEADLRLHSPARSSVTDEESVDGESGNETFDAVDGVDNTERLIEESQRLSNKIEKTKERMRKLQCSMDENLEEYLESVKDNPDPELSKKLFEKKNLKSNQNIGQLQKKLDKYQKALKDLETCKQARSHTAKEMLRGVKTSVKELSGGVRDGVKAGFTGAVSKFFNSNENITDANPLSKSDSECHDITHGDELDQNGGYDLRKERTPSPKNVFSEEDNYSLISGNQTSASAAASPKFCDATNEQFEARLKEIQEAHVTLQETVDKALSNINAIATSLQEERYKTQRLECQFNELRSHWNDFSELHQNEIMVLRQEMERADERIETVDYRIVERVAEIDESFDTFDARISKIENLHHQQGLTVDDYLEQNTQAKAVFTKFLSVLLAIVTLLFSIFTLIVHGIAPLTRTRVRLVITAILVAFVALWWHNPDHYLVIHFQRHIVEPSYDLLQFFSKKITRLNKAGQDIPGNNTREDNVRGVNARGKTPKVS